MTFTLITSSTRYPFHEPGQPYYFAPFFAGLLVNYFSTPATKKTYAPLF